MDISDKDVGGRKALVALDNTPFKRDSKGKLWIDYYGIQLEQKTKLPKEKYFKGAMWMKNICLDKPGKWNIYWDFDEKFSNELAARFNNTYHYGVPYYRGKSIKVWDTLRDFYK